MAEKKFIVTVDGLEKLKKELQLMETEKRKDVAEKIAEALKFGDLRENAEYHEAKDEQAALETKILMLSAQIKNAEVISIVSNDTVQVGCKVALEDLDSKEKFDYEIVGSMEANVFENKISNESPLGESLLGQKKGQKVTFEAPGGEMSYKIKKIY